MTRLGLILLCTLAGFQDPNPARNLVDSVKESDPEASFRAISDLVDFAESRPAEVEAEAKRLPVFYREFLESELKAKRELGPRFGKADRLRLKGKQRTYLDFLDDIKNRCGLSYTISAQAREQVNAAPFDVDLEGWPLELIVRLSKRAGQRVSIWSPWMNSEYTILPDATMGASRWCFYRNVAIQAWAGGLTRCVDFSARPLQTTTFAFQALSDGGFPIVRTTRRRLIEVLDQTGKSVAEVPDLPTSLPPVDLSGGTTMPGVFSFKLAAEGVESLSRVRFAFDASVALDVRRFVLTQFDPASPGRASDEWFEVESAMDEGVSPGEDRVAIRVTPKRERHADLEGVPIVVNTEFDSPGPRFGGGGTITGKRESTTVYTWWCSLRGGRRKPKRLDVVIPVGLKERTFYAEFRDIPLK